MYRLAQFLRHKMPFIWELIEFINSTAFGLRYRSGLRQLPDLIADRGDGSLRFALARPEDADGLVAFFSKQPTEAFEYFRPHEFDRKSLMKLIANKSFIMVLAFCDSEVVGYAFVRCFMNGKAFRGKIVDVNFRGRGIARTFGVLTTEIASLLGIGLYGTISKSNVSSMASSLSSNEIRIIEELPDNYLLIQYLPKKEYSA